MKRLTLWLGLLVVAATTYAQNTLPITGTWLNLAYQDVRNRYTNPAYFDHTSPELWSAKVAELADMGVEYLVFMAVANEGKAYYPSKLMPHHYPDNRQSPVDAIMDAAANHGLKVFMSSGWAKDQDDNLRIPAIKQRQMDMMAELAELYGSHPALYGWYLPVEDCLGPVLSDYAVEAVNALTARARELTPDKKILISPYGIFNSDFDHPRYAEQIRRLAVDIIAYQDEVGCVREQFPLPRLRENWHRLKEVHRGTNIAMWANCETFTWSHNTNDRSSALIPAAYERLLAQQVAATEAGVERVISFMMCGIFESPHSDYRLGQPDLSARAWSDYMAWRGGDRWWRLYEASLRGRVAGGTQVAASNHPALVDGAFGQECATDSRWTSFGKGLHSVELQLPQQSRVEGLMVRLLSYSRGDIVLPEKIFVYAHDSARGDDERLVAIMEPRTWPNDRHDCWTTIALTESSFTADGLRIAFESQEKVMIDEIILSPTLAE